MMVQRNGETEGKINLFLLEPRKKEQQFPQKRKTVSSVYNKVKPNFKTNIIGGKCFHEKGN